MNAQTDLGLRSRTFSLKIKLPTFSEITQRFIKDCVLYGQMSSHPEFQLQIMF